MPLPPGTKYRWKTEPSGKKVRLAFDPSDNVIEAKSQSGAIHTPAEFEQDAAKAQKSYFRKGGK